MGIRGLTTYIANRSDYYLDDYELSKTKLVIDGWNLCSQLFISHTQNYVFGGDYDHFAHHAVIFFNELLCCKIEPLVILDGAWEDKKYSTLVKRFEERLLSTSNYDIANPRSSAIISMLTTEIFINVLRKLKIQFFVCTFEADDSIAGLARTLNCPVLSYDSDYFIYGVKYIPINTLNPNVIKINGEYVRKCKIYKTEKLYSRFDGLNQTLLPLASVLLGNDYINPNVFRNFINLTLSKNSPKFSTEQCKFEKVFTWLSNLSLNSALKQIIRYLPSYRKKKIIHDIESVINSYLNTPTYILKAFGFDEEFIDEVKKNNTIFKYEYKEEEEEDDDDDKERKQKDRKVLTIIEPEAVFASSVPDWFMENISKGNYSSYFINILTHRTYMLTLQSEEWSLPSAHDISFPLIRKIVSLLVTLDSDSNDDPTIMKLVTRQEKTVVTKNLVIPKSCISLENVQCLSYCERKDIIDETLGIRGNFLEELPSTWRLYVGTILYWIQQDSIPLKTEIHVNCLLLSMMTGIIDDQIGFCRSTAKFEKKYANDLAQILAETKLDQNNENHSTDITSLIHSVSTKNCISALSFFLEHYGLDKKLQTNPDKFERKIVHVFSQFQSLLRHVGYLNALLGRIYIEPDFNKFFNGTLLYNLYKNLKTRENIHNYICTRLKNSSTILQIFTLLKSKIFDFVSTKDYNFHEEKIIPKRKRKKNKNKSKAKDQENNDFSPLYDPNNQYATLI